MKKNIKSIGILVFIAILLAGLNAQDVATILKVSGTVDVRRSDSEAFVTAVMGTKLQNGDILRTHKDGLAALFFTDDKSLVKIRKNSLVSISQEFGIRSIKLDSGKVLVKVTPGTPTLYRVETPTSVASVKGTQFWVITSPGTGDRFYGIEGLVEIVNLVTGQTAIMSAGQMVISTPEGQMMVIPVGEDEIPRDVEEEQIPQQPQEEQVPEETGMESAQAQIPQPETTVPEEQVVPEVTQKQEKPTEPSRERPYDIGLGLGSVTIDNQIYNQVALRPEMRFGKIGVGLDLVFYFDQNGKLRKNEWDEFSDYLDKIYYLRYGTTQDPFFIKIGALDNVTLGYGILLNGYSNTTEYPQVRKVGLYTGFRMGNIGIEGFVANIKEVFGPGLMAGRVTYRLSEKLPLTFGGTLVIDGNQYSGMKDTDRDGVPDAFDAFPDKKFTLPDYYPVNAYGFNPGEEIKGNKYSKDSDEDGIPDEIDYDIDGDGMTDNYEDPSKNFDDSVRVVPDPFNIKEERKSVSAISVDVGYPVLNMNFLKLHVYAQAASFIPFWKVTDYQTKKEFTPGWGIAAPGARANIMKFINLALEYRLTGGNFVYGFWDRAYDYERVIIRTRDDGTLWPYTKDEMKLKNEAMQGVFGSLSGNILNYVILSGYYQQMFTKNGDVLRSFLLTADVPKGKIPRLAGATAFYQRNNDENPFDFKHPSENTIWGYRIGFETGGGVIISYIYQTTYRDYDGNGKIDPKTEAITLTTIETSFGF
ncbi:MAG: FecR domain-containing protein [Candidatus Marinimicrobia bacterium]|nr:FecR domain-containing protein [Candidatus Neomarinimicrobiota bacterium]